MAVKVISEQHCFYFDGNVALNVIGHKDNNNVDYANYSTLQIYKNQCPHKQQNIPAKFSVRAELEREIGSVLRRMDLGAKEIISEKHTVIFLNDKSGQQMSFVFVGKPNSGVSTMQSNQGMASINIDIKCRQGLIAAAKTVLGVK